MPKRRVEDYPIIQHRDGDFAGKRSRPARRRKHLYLVLDDWEKGFSIHKIDGDSFDSDSDDDASRRVDAAGHLTEPPVVRLESPGMLVATVGSKIFIVTDARYGQTPALVYDTETAGLAIGPAAPSHLRCGFDVVVPSRGMLYAFSPPSCNELLSFCAMSCAANGSHHHQHRPGDEEEPPGWSWRSLPSPQPPFDFYEVVTSYAVHSDGRTIFMTTSYRDRPGLQKSTCSFNAKHSVWRWHSWVLPFRGQGYFDGELDAWVGLDRDGHICSCEVPSDVGSETPVELGTAQLDWQVAEEKLIGDREAEMHLRASLAYIGKSKFCLVRSVRHDDGACVLHLTMFGLKYNNKGGLCITNHRSSRSYRVPKHRDAFYPEAFWL